MSLLNSLVEIGFFSVQEKQEFLNSLNTVSKRLSKKVANLNEENKLNFLAEFGHLRPNTYNLLSPRYDESFEDYFDLDCKQKMNLEDSTFTLDSKKLESLDILLGEHGLKIGAQEFWNFEKGN